jgi:membrane protein DedA with SNARE-associated domain
VTPRRIAVAVALVALAATVALLLATDTVRPPDLEALITDVSDRLGAWTYPLVAGFAFLETGAFVGLLAPGETAIVVGGLVAAQGDVQLVPLIALAWAGAALGDLASYGLGRRLGRRFLVARGPRVGVGPARLARLDDFFARYGGRAVLAGRFVGFLRALLPFMAGASGLPLRGFLPWSLVGTGLWATAFTLVGYVFHRSIGSATGTLTHALLAVALVAGALVAWHAHRGARRRAVQPARA